MKPTNFEILQALAEFEGFLTNNVQNPINLNAIAEYTKMKMKILNQLKLKDSE